MRIAYLSASLIPSRTANSVHVMSMGAAMARVGHCVSLYGRRGSLDDPYVTYGVGGFDLRLLPQSRLPGIRAIAYARAIYKELSASPPDLIYARHLLGLVAVRRLGLPLIYEAHTPPANRLRRRLEHVLFRSPNFSRLVVISNALGAWYRENMASLPEKKIVVAHDAANDLAIDRSGTVPKRASDRFAVGYIGQLYPGKGMEIISRLPDLLPDVDFHVVGGCEADLSRWRPLLSSPNLKMHGYVPHAALRHLMRSFDAVLAPYQRVVTGYGKSRDISSWMSPLKIFEYMAAGLPMVVSDLPVLKEVLEHDRNALMVAPDDVRSWAAAIRRLQASSDLRVRLCRNARDDFVRCHSWDRRAQAVLNGI